MPEDMAYPGLAKLTALLHGEQGVLRPPKPSYSPRFDLYGPQPAVRDIAELIGAEHFETKVTEVVEQSKPKMYTIGQMAKQLERTTYTMHTWLSMGALPEAVHWSGGTRGNGQKRLYCEYQVWGLRIILLEEGLLSHTNRKPLSETAFTARAYALFDECTPTQCGLRRQ
jgi:hypothetical protein